MKHFILRAFAKVIRDHQCCLRLFSQGAFVTASKIDWRSGMQISFLTSNIALHIAKYQRGTRANLFLFDAKCKKAICRYQFFGC